MPTFKQKNVIKSYKLRLQEKLKTVSEETENATTFLNNCVLEFSKRVQHILSIKDEKCLSLYRKLIKDLENYSEKLFILQASIEEVTEEDSDSSEDVADDIGCKLYEAEPKLSASVSPQNATPVPSAISDVEVSEIASYEVTSKFFHSAPFSQNATYDNVNESEAKFCEVESKSNPSANLFSQNETHSYGFTACVGKSVQLDQQDELSGSFTEDDFFSLHSDSIMQKLDSSTVLVNSEIDRSFNKPVSEGKYESSRSFSQSSCYRSLSSNISDSVAFCNDKKSHSFELQSADVKNQHSEQLRIQHLETEQTVLLSDCVICPSVIKVPSSISATLSYIVNPSDFWIQLENSHSSNINFPRSESIHLENLSSVKQGDYCLAPFKSSPFFYRAQSLSDAKYGREMVKVLFIDHGSTQELFLCDLRSLPSSAYDIPAQAIHCFLYGITPVNDSWSDECIERFKEFQNFCIEAIIKSKEHLYGVQLTAKISADLEEDFSVDIAQSFCFDGLAMPVIKSPPKLAGNLDQKYESQPSKLVCKKTDSSLEVSESYDVNAISSDSGVSVTSAYKSSQISNIRNQDFNNIAESFFQTVSVVDSSNGSCDKKLFDFNGKLIKDLISFDSCDALENSNDFSSAICHMCKRNNFCLHLKIPPPSLVYVEKDMMLVMISHIVNPSEFYVNMAMESIVTLDELREQMTSTYESQKKSSHLIKVDDLSEGMFCAGRYEDDGYWYRVKIIQLKSQGEKMQVLVQYVDYGNMSVIKHCDLLPLSSQFSEHPAFAIKCCLAKVTPISASSWDEEAVRIFKQVTSSDRCLTAQIVNELHNSDSKVYNVFLWDTEDSSDLLINVALADHGVAIFDYPVFSSSPFKQKVVKPPLDMNILNTWDPMFEEYHDIENSYALNDEDIEIATSGYRAKDEEYTCKYFSLRGYCPRAENCPYKHLSLVETGATRDQEEVYCLDLLLIVPDSVNNILVQVSAIINPGHFYVILPFGCKTVNEIDQLVCRGSKYEEIMNYEVKSMFYAVNKYYSTASFEENTRVALSCGTIVAAKRNWDKQWHRGRVVDVSDITGPTKVFFVDSGDHEWVPRKYIRTILPQFLHTPFQAIQCSLHGIEPVGAKEGKRWQLDSVNYFKSAVDGAVLLAEIKDRLDQVLHVTLRKTSKNNHQHISQLLVSKNFAEFCPTVHLEKRETLYVPG